MSSNDIWTEGRLSHILTANYDMNNRNAQMNESISFNSPVPRWNQGSLDSPVDCFILQLFGILSVFLFALSLAANSLLLFVFYKHRSLCSPMNIFVITLTIFNEICTIVEWPFIIGSNLFCR